MSSEMRRDVFQAIADPTRREILTLVASQPLNLNALARNFSISRPAVSQHVKILEECGLIKIRKDGRERYCVPDLGKLGEVSDWLEPLKILWEDRFEKLDSLLEEMKLEKTKKHE